MRTVDAAEFRDAMKPTVDGLRALANAVDDLEQRSRPPAAESRAMSEIAAEQALSERSDWNDPLSVTHGNGALTLRAAADYVRGFAQVFTGDERIPMWAHLVLSRAALEASVISAWLNEPGAEPLERMKRGLVEQLYSAREVERLKLPGSMPNEEWWLKVAADLGWTVTWSNRKPVVDGSKRPSIPAGISRLIVDDEERQIGRTLWSRLSAVTHVSWWGLNWAFMHPGGEADAAGFVTLGIGTDQAVVAEQAFCILRALQAAAQARAILVSFHRDERWQQACNDADQLAVALLRASTGAIHVPFDGQNDVAHDRIHLPLVAQPAFCFGDDPHSASAGASLRNATNGIVKALRRPVDRIRGKPATRRPIKAAVRRLMSTSRGSACASIRAMQPSAPRGKTAECMASRWCGSISARDPLTAIPLARTPRRGRT